MSPSPAEPLLSPGRGQLVAPGALNKQASRDAVLVAVAWVDPNLNVVDRWLRPRRPGAEGWWWWCGC